MLSEFSIVIAVGTHVSFLKSALTPWNEFCLIPEICLVLNFSYLFIAFNSATLELCRTLDIISYSPVLISSCSPGSPPPPHAHVWCSLCPCDLLLFVSCFPAARPEKLVLFQSEHREDLDAASSKFRLVLLNLSGLFGILAAVQLLFSLCGCSVGYVLPCL